MWAAAEQITWKVISELEVAQACEGVLLADIMTTLPDRSMLFIGNSGPIRHFNQFVPPQARIIYPLANRGASGIDGSLASALGAATGRFDEGKPGVLVTGDLALYYDLNSLHLIRRLHIPLIVVCINNDGGGLFHRLPIANYEPPFRELFQTPHGLTFEGAAKMFNLPYTLAQMGAEFRAAFKKALETGGPGLIEVPSDPAKFERQRLELIDTVAQRIAEQEIVTS
jgi:2-succinyl-5-enolpyruvyl-6-hydroxy-3-cyclohexene-1-carboxylate synthase